MAARFLTEADMQNIHVKRYADNGHSYCGSIEPEDRSWIVFIDNEGNPSLWVEAETEDEDGQTIHGYACVTLTEMEPLAPEAG